MCKRNKLTFTFFMLIFKATYTYWLWTVGNHSAKGSPKGTYNHWRILYCTFLMPESAAVDLGAVPVKTPSILIAQSICLFLSPSVLLKQSFLRLCNETDM